MTASAGATAPGSNRPPRKARGFGSLLLAFLLGVLFTAAAAVTLLLLDVVGSDDAASGAAPTAPAEAPSDDASDDAAATGDVPRACVEAAEYNQTFTEAMDEIAIGVRDQDARRLQEALDAVQDAQPGSEEASQECRDLAGAGEGEGATSEDDETSEESPEPEPSPTSPEPSPGEPTATPTP